MTCETMWAVGWKDFCGRLAVGWMMSDKNSLVGEVMTVREFVSVGLVNRTLN